MIKNAFFQKTKQRPKQFNFINNLYLIAKLNIMYRKNTPKFKYNALAFSILTISIAFSACGKKEEPKFSDYPAPSVAPEPTPSTAVENSGKTKYLSLSEYLISEVKTDFDGSEID